MRKTDKAVSTDDLSTGIQKTMCLETAKLEAVFKALVENKVEAIKNDKNRLSNFHSSPKDLVHRLQGTSSSSATSSKDNQFKSYCQDTNYKKREQNGVNKDESDRKSKKYKAEGRTKAVASSLSPKGARHRTHHYCSKSFSDEETNEIVEFLNCDNIFSTGEYSVPNVAHPCCYADERNSDMKMHYSNEYISLKIEDFDDAERRSIIHREDIKRAKRKRRRRKRRMKRHIELAALPVPELVKVLDPDELPRRARWTIVATACLLLFMCLLLVGITLRMAPIIDDMVRKENEELMNSLHREPLIYHHNLLNITPAQAQK